MKKFHNIHRKAARASAKGYFWYFKTAAKHRLAAAFVLTLLLSSDHLLTGC